MGQRGVIPKRSDQLIRRNKPDVPVTKVAAIGGVEIPDLGIEDPHPMVVDLYDSMKDSAQSRFYEPSDWQFARLTLYFVNDLLKSNKKSSMMLSSLQPMLTSLLLTEGDRRRVRLEVERNASSSGEGGEHIATVSDMFRERLSR